jgi:hypothetical protein
MLERHTAVVQGPLAYGMRRATAARAGECGLQILNPAQLAARLAGGFRHLATADTIEPAIRQALGEGGFQEIAKVTQLPGMPRAVARTLRKAWHADLNLSERASSGIARIVDLALIAERVKRALPPATLLPADLRDAALARIRYAPALLGPVRIEGMHFVEPVWRPLFNGLCTVVPVEWDAPVKTDTEWFKGQVLRSTGTAAIPEIVSCADPRHEALEALRWVRELLASGRAKANEIAVCAASTDEWDDHILSLAGLAQLRIHFPHGVTCLSTRDGQRCAALADVLLNGLSQERVRRLFSLARGQGLALDALPRDWMSVPRGAMLGTAADWKRALNAAAPANGEWQAIVFPLLSVLEKRASGATQAAAAFLRGRSRVLWDMATRSAPADALELTLRTIKVHDERDPGDSVVWCPAFQLAAAPRPFVRLLGLTSRGWPRRPGEDALLPGHLLPPHELDVDPSADADRRAFAIICSSTGQSIVLSRSRRNAQGNLVGASPLLPMDAEGEFLAGARTPLHALTESDRLSARPVEATETAQVQSALRCWRDWHDTKVTAHDGLIRPSHPVIVKAISRVQSPTSLTRLLRDPIGFVWSYALGWQALDEKELPLSLPANEFGRLVHEVLRRAVNALEPSPGLNSAKPHEIEAAIEDAAKAVLDRWPIKRPVPPHVLWLSTVRQAAEMSLAGLKLQEVTEAGTRSWTEVPFGQPASVPVTRELPWDPSLLVTIPGTTVAIRGSIDRVDLRETGFAVRVTDYKTGTRPKNPERIIIGGGRELQRALYALACRQLLPETKIIRAGLVYLSDQPAVFPLHKPDDVFSVVSEFVSAACALLESGKAMPGPGSEEVTNDLRFALPVSPGYFRRKGLRFREVAGSLTRFWNYK